MRQTFNNYSGLAALYLMWLDPSALADLAFTFASCSGLEMIYVAGNGVLLVGCAGMGTFYGCSWIVGGNGTSYSSSATGCFTARFTDLALGECAWLAHDGQAPDEE